VHLSVAVDLRILKGLQQFVLSRSKAFNIRSPSFDREQHCFGGAAKWMWRRKLHQRTPSGGAVRHRAIWNVSISRMIPGLGADPRETQGAKQNPSLKLPREKFTEVWGLRLHHFALNLSRLPLSLRAKVGVISLCLSSIPHS